MLMIPPQENLFNRGRVLLDVRSPGEYAAGHLPGAKSLPLFDDQERAEVGTLYKQVDPDTAMLRGLEIAGGKMRALVERARDLAAGRPVAVHCWRGGQRSRSVGWLLGQAGMDVRILEGGYKAARRVIRRYLAESPHTFRVLSGPTGTGKTQILRAMQIDGTQVIDLEALARHKGSSFGAIGEPDQPTTEQFENDLFNKLREIPAGEVVWFEDESRMIGRVYQPDEFFRRLMAAPVLTVKQPLEWRADRLVDEYGTAPASLLKEAFTRIRKKLGGQNLNHALEAIDRGDLFTAARIGLIYYDKAYEHSTRRRNPTILSEVSAISPDPFEIAEQLKNFAEKTLTEELP